MITKNMSTISISARASNDEGPWEALGGEDRMVALRADECLGVTLKTLEKLSRGTDMECWVKDGDWVWLQSLADDHSDDACPRAFRVSAVKEKNRDAHEDDVPQIYLTPTAFFNLGLETTSISSPNVFLRVFPFVVGGASRSRFNNNKAPCSCCRDPNVPALLRPSREILPPTATSVQLARVRTPYSSGYSNYVPLLKSYFSVPRCLSKGDIIAVGAAAGAGEMFCFGKAKRDNDGSNINLMPGMETIAHPACKEKESDGENNDAQDAICIDAHDASGDLLPSSRIPIFFKVADVQGPKCAGCYFDDRYCVDGAATAITQAGAESAFVPSPRLAKCHLSGAPCSPQVPVDDRAVEALSSAIMPSLFVSALATSTCGSSCASAVLLHGKRYAGKRVLAQFVAEKYGVHFVEVNLLEMRGLGEQKIKAEFETELESALRNAPCMLYLRGIEVLAGESPASATGAEEKGSTVGVQFLKEALQKCSDASSSEEGFPVAVVASACAPLNDLPAGLQSCFSDFVRVPFPNLDHRARILSHAARNAALAPGVDFAALASMLSGRSPLDIVHLVGAAVAQCDGPELDEAAFERALGDLPPPSSMSVDAPKIPSVKWEDVGGLSDARQEITDMIQLPLLHPELFSSGEDGEAAQGGRSGILLYGPPGTGKTLLAKAVATECNLNFISVKGPELLDMYVGESERKVREVFELARTASPAVLFFDELDSLAPQRGRGSDGGGVMDRVVSQLLTELGGVQQAGAANGPVFVIGATNRPDLLDQSLLRPGRFDRLVYLGVSKTREDRLKIIHALTRKFAHDDDVDLGAIVDACGSGFTGADFSAVASEAMGSALRRRVADLQRQVDQVNARDLYSSAPECTPFSLLEQLSEDEMRIVVKQSDFEAAAASVVPSVSADELRHYEGLRAKFSQGGS